MAKNNNLTDFLTNTADAIRDAEKKVESATASTETIDPQDFDARILGLRLDKQTEDADATAGQILSGKTAYVNGVKVTGNIPTKTSSNLAASGATVTVPAGYYASNASKSVTTATRAGTTISVTADDTNDKLTITGSNTQTAGYVSDTSAKTASTTVTLTASGKTVTATATDGTKVSKDVGTVSRASTTATTTADDTADTLTIAASNNQGTGYVTGSNKTASKVVTLGVAKPTIDASGNVTAVATATDNSSTPVSVSKTSETLALGAKSSSDLTVSGAKVTVPAGYYPAAAEKSVSTTSRANTSISVTVDDTADTLKIDASNNQSTGYVTGANKTATTTVTLTASGATVTATETGGKKVSKSVNTVGRADTTLTSSKNTTNNTLDFTASNNQGTGYVTGANKTATKSVSLSASGATVTATDGTNSISKSVASGAISASGTASATTTVAPGTVTVANKTAAVSGKTQITASPTTATSGISTYYMAVGATAAANSTGTTSNISGTATAKVDTAGYVSSDATGSVTGTATAKTSAKSSSTYYIPVASGGCTVAGGGLSVTNNYSGTPTVDITLDDQTTSGVAITDTKPSSGYYLTVGANSSALSGSTKVTRAAVTDTHTAGYIPAKSATNVINSTSASPTVTVNAGSKTEYITIPSGGCTVSGGGLSAGSGSVSASGTNITLTEVSSKPSSGYYVTAQGSGSVNRAAITDTHTAGYIPAKSATTVSSATSASSITATKYYTLPSGSYGASGGGLSAGAGSVSASSSNMSLTESSSQPSSGYYFTTQGSGSVNRAAITKSATGGVISTGSATVSNATSASSNTATKYYSVPTGSCSVSGGGLSGGSSVTPTVSLSSGSDTNMSNITVGSKNTSTYPYYFKVNGSSSSGSSTVSRAAVTDTHTAGYIPDKSSTTVISSASKTVTVNTGSGSSYVGLKGASLSASGSATINPTVEPGKLSIDTLTADEHTAAYGQYSGTGTLITPSIVDDPDAITFPYVIALKPEVAAGSASINGSGTASASVSTAGYAPTNLTGSGSVSVSGTATSTAKIGNPYYIPLWGATPNQNASLSLVNAGSTALDVDVIIPQDGYIKAGTKSLSADLKDLPGGENLMASNIKKDVYMLGFTGTLEGPSNFIPYSPKLTRESSDYAGGTVTYRFQETDDGYWESSNKGVNSSFSLGRFSFEVFETCDVTFEVINYAEANYDYAIFSKLDSSYFSNNTTADSSAYKSFKGSSSSSIQELTYYSVSPGTHTIAVKFIKDTSSHNYNDSVKFRLKRPTPNSELLPQVESLEPTYQGRGANEPGSKHVVNYYSGSNYIQVYRNVEKGGWVQDNTSFFGDDYIYLDKIDTSKSGLKPENIVAGKTIFGVTGTGPAITNISFNNSYKGTTLTFPGLVWSYIIENTDSITVTDLGAGQLTVTAKSGAGCDTMLVVKHYTSTGATSTTLSYYYIQNSTTGSV